MASPRQSWFTTHFGEYRRGLRSIGRGISAEKKVEHQVNQSLCSRYEPIFTELLETRLLVVGSPDDQPPVSLRALALPGRPDRFEADHPSRRSFRLLRLEQGAVKAIRGEGLKRQVLTLAGEGSRAALSTGCPRAHPLLRLGPCPLWLLAVKG